MFFSYYPPDRSGTQLTSILGNYFYCYQNNLVYGGSIPIKKKKNYWLYLRNIRNTQELITFLNLPKSDMIPEQPKIINKEEISNLSSEFRDLLYNNMKTNLSIIKKDSEVIVSIHVRRGDVSPNGRWSFRYTNDDYYFTLIEEIYKYKPDAKIYLFSESSFGEQSNYSRYCQLNCIFKLGTSMTEAFNYMIQSDIFIMSASSFSLIPALYRRQGLTISVPSKYWTDFDDWTCGSIDEKKDAIQKFILNFNSG